MCFKSFLQYNPRWKVILYTPVKLTQTQSWTTFENKQTFDTLDYSDRLEELGVRVCPFDMESIGFSNDLSEVTKSDIIRLHLLSTVGGLWSDSDIVYFRPLSNTFDQTDHQAYFCYRKGGPTQDGPDPKYHSIGFLAGSPGNRYFRKLFEGIPQPFDMNNYQAVGSPYYKTMIADPEFAADPLLMNIDVNTVYPTRAAHNICVDPAGRFMQEVVGNPVTIGLHWYCGAPSAGKHQNQVTEETYLDMDDIVCWLVDKVNLNVPI
jgi:hypothetical protein